jgi:hypothetical protein
VQLTPLIPSAKPFIEFEDKENDDAGRYQDLEEAHAPVTQYKTQISKQSSGCHDHDEHDKYPYKILHTTVTLPADLTEGFAGSYRIARRIQKTATQSGQKCR